MADVVRVEGPDAAKYLHGQLSQDIEGLPVGEKTWSFLLEPNGHIDALMRVTREGEEAFVLTVDAGLGERVDARLRKFLLRTKATVTLESGGDDDELARIEAGRPGIREFDERAVPAETGWVARAVSFTKGCYTGQELVARMDSRVAEPPRRLVRIAADVDIAPGAAIEIDGKDVGNVTSAVAGAALGYVKRGAPLEGRALVDGAEVLIRGPVGE